MSRSHLGFYLLQDNPSSFPLVVERVFDDLLPIALQTGVEDASVVYELVFAGKGWNEVIAFGGNVVDIFQVNGTVAVHGTSDIHLYDLAVADMNIRPSADFTIIDFDEEFEFVALRGVYAIFGDDAFPPAFQ